jgi:hypothetical protein
VTSWKSLSGQRCITTFKVHCRLQDLNLWKTARYQFRFLFSYSDLRFLKINCDSLETFTNSNTFSVPKIWISKFMSNTRNCEWRYSLGCWGIGLKRNTRQLLGLLILIVGTLCTRVQSQISVKPIIQATKCLSDTMQVIPKRARSPSDVKFGGEYASFTAVHLMFMFCVILDPRTKSKSPCTSRKYHSFFCLPY